MTFKSINFTDAAKYCRAKPRLAALLPTLAEWRWGQ